MKDQLIELIKTIDDTKTLNLLYACAVELKKKINAEGVDLSARTNN
ncbi:hypothetical protein CLPUN_32670 [Clostridium puniceum]|uniref:Uncharacterized protein n=1 Tax=Clostridium puniceum TaxID=29367 RepID=A0A1S8TCI6_9CLOT|nr:hypothetical protein [Clostridium puniceum]OOM75456.1 hypothetical protein CLPUN_32670 [Clostridium puniceum]